MITGRKIVAFDGSVHTVVRENATIRWCDYFLNEFGGLKAIVGKDGTVHELNLFKDCRSI